MVYLRPKNILIIGGASGIGYATAQKLLENGAQNIILASRNNEKLSKAASELRKCDNQRIHYATFDIASCSSHMQLIEKCNEMIDAKCDGLVISAGINFDGSRWKGFNISEKDWDMVMDTNLKGVFFLLRTFANYLYDNGIKGNICVVSSISAHRDLLSVYQISKNAISGIVHAYGKHLAERGVVLNAVEPGITNTEMMRFFKDYTDGIRPGKPWGDNSIQRLIRPEEIAEIIMMLMSNISEILSGTCLLAGGGCKTIYR